MLYGGGVASLLFDSSGGQEGVTNVDTGDSLCDDDLLVILMVLPVDGGLSVFLFIIHIPIKHMIIMPITAAKLMMSGHLIFSSKGVANVGGISSCMLFLINFVEFKLIFISSKCSSITSIRCFKMCISSGLFELNLTESQLIFSERMLHVRGNLIFA